MANELFKAKLTITQDDLDAKYQEFAKKNKSIEEWIDLKNKQLLEWKVFHDELNSYAYDGICGIPGDEYASPFLKSVFFEIRRELFYNVKDLLNDPLYPDEIKFLIDGHEQFQTLHENTPLEHFVLPSKVKNDNDSKDYIRQFRFLYQLWNYVQNGQESINETLGNIVHPEKLKEVLNGGRKMGSDSNKDKAEVRHKGLRDAAITKFKKNPGFNYDECVDWIISEDQLLPFRTFTNNNKPYTRKRIKQIIKGTKKIALDPTSR